ncbi:hypothetical protein B0H13DRAFT_1896999 [Mycena leptocephala]|nr:hypothetical protein B0H13DRAFT_1896999 [Mycena leptocephala]
MEESHQIGPIELVLAREVNDVEIHPRAFRFGCGKRCPKTSLKLAHALLHVVIGGVVEQGIGNLGHVPVVFAEDVDSAVEGGTCYLDKHLLLLRLQRLSFGLLVAGCGFRGPVHKIFNSFFRPARRREHRRPESTLMNRTSDIISHRATGSTGVPSWPLIENHRNLASFVVRAVNPGCVHQFVPVNILKVNEIKVGYLNF